MRAGHEVRVWKRPVDRVAEVMAQGKAALDNLGEVRMVVLADRDMASTLFFVREVEA